MLQATGFVPMRAPANPWLQNALLTESEGQQAVCLLQSAGDEGLWSHIQNKGQLVSTRQDMEPDVRVGGSGVAAGRRS